LAAVGHHRLFSQYGSQLGLCYATSYSPPSSGSKLGAGSSSIPFKRWAGSRWSCSPPFSASWRHLTQQPQPPYAHAACQGRIRKGEEVEGAFSALIGEATGTVEHSLAQMQTQAALSTTRAAQAG